MNDKEKEKNMIIKDLSLIKEISIKSPKGNFIIYSINKLELSNENKEKIKLFFL